MERQKEGKLNQLPNLLPEGLVVDAAWLEKHGYSRSLRSRYAAKGWLAKLGGTVYWRPPHKPGRPDAPESPRWENVVVSLQTLLLANGPALVVGGRTALEVEGYAHYLSPGGPREIHLYGHEPAPTWLNRIGLESRFVFHNSRRLFREDPIARGIDSRWIDIQTGMTHAQSALGGEHFLVHPWGQWNWAMTLSTPERAILELLDELPNRETFHQADVLMDGLRGLRPKRLQKLLADCRSVKVKRLFLWFAERHGHGWLRHLDTSKIDLGKGKRMLAKGGRYDAKYRITVPEAMMRASSGGGRDDGVH